MNHTDVEMFLTIVRCQNLSAAAKQLYVTQPAVSSSLKRLEKKLGCQLFQRCRGNHSLSLTEEGQAFLPLAEQWLKLWQTTYSAVSLNRRRLFRVDAIATAADYFFPQVFHRFSQEHPDVCLEVKRCHSKEGYESIFNNKTSIAFVAEDRTLPSVETHPLYQEPMVLLAHKDSGYYHGIDPEYLNVEHALLIPWNSEFTSWFSHCYGNTQTPYAYLNQIMLAIPYFQDSCIWSIVPLSIASTAIQLAPNLQYYHLNKGPSGRIIYYLSKGNDLNPLALDLIRLTKEHLSTFPEIHSFL